MQQHNEQRLRTRIIVVAKREAVVVAVTLTRTAATMATKDDGNEGRWQRRTVATNDDGNDRRWQRRTAATNDDGNERRWQRMTVATNDGGNERRWQQTTKDEGRRTKDE